MKLSEYLFKCGAGKIKEIENNIKQGYIKVNNEIIKDDVEIKSGMKIKNGAFMTFYIK